MGFHRRFVAGLIVSASFVSCQTAGPSGSQPSEARTETKPDQKMERIRLQTYGPDGLRWELLSPLGEGFSINGRTIVDKLKVDLYSQSQKSTTVTADTGVIFSGAGTSSDGPEPFHVPVTLEPGDMFLNGHVVLVSTEGHTLSTDWAHYQKKFDLIVSSAPVELVRDDSITRGIGLEAVPDMSVVKIFKETLVIKDTPKKDEN